MRGIGAMNNRKLTVIEDNNLEKINTLEEDKKIVDLKLITGGKDSDGPWLMKLEEGTVFVIRDLGDPRNFNLGQFQLVSKTDKSVLLYTNIGGKILTRVDPSRFCQRYSLVEILGIVRDEPQELMVPEED